VCFKNSVPGCAAEGSDAPEKGENMEYRLPKWDDLKESFGSLGSFFIQEWSYIPEQIKKQLPGWKISKDDIKIPLVFITMDRKNIRAEMELYESELGYYIIKISPQEEPKDTDLGVLKSAIQLDGWPNYFPHPMSYEEFTQKLEVMFSGKDPPTIKLIERYASEVLERAYYDLHKALVNFFAKIYQNCSGKEKSIWEANKKELRAKSALQQIIEICERSRATVGTSKTLGTIRVAAQKALNGNQCPPVPIILSPQLD
jgi:hypothetical protein